MIFFILYIYMNVLRLVDKFLNIESHEESKNDKNKDFQNIV